MYPERSIRAAALFLAGLALSFTLASCMDVGDDDDKPPFCLHSTRPEPGATDIPLISNISITFDTDVDGSSVTDSTLTVSDPSGTVLDGKVDASAVNAYFSLPDGVYFSPYTKYTVRLSGNIRDKYGRRLGECMNGDYEFSFTTGSDTTTSQ
jgi:hypothetical protein